MTDTIQLPINVAKNMMILAGSALQGKAFNGEPEQFAALWQELSVVKQALVAAQPPPEPKPE
jgi:hypothetical protein